MGEIVTPRLFLGVNGVLVAPEPPYDVVRQFDEDRSFAPEVAEQLGATGMELVLVDLDEHAARAFADCAPEFSAARVLERGAYKHHLQPGIRWIVDAIVGDLHDRPAPFMWVSSRINDEERALLNHEFGGLAHVALPSDPRTGLNPSRLSRIKDFAVKHTAR